MAFLDNIFSIGGKRIPVEVSYTNDGSRSPLTLSMAERISTVYTCVNIISDDVGTLPLHVKFRNQDNKIEKLYSHPVARVLLEPNPFMTGIDFRRALVACVKLHGNGYAHISERDKRGYPTRLDLIMPDKVHVSKGKNDLFYTLTELGVTVPSRDMLHIKGSVRDGILGKSPLTEQRELLDNANNMSKFSKNIYKRDLRHAAVFQTDAQLKDNAFERLRKQLTAMWSNAHRNNDPLLLDDGLKIATVTITPEDAQFIATKLLTIDEIAAVFRVPAHKVGDWTRGTYSNNTQANLEYFTDCIRPLLEIVEAEFNRKLFLESEKEDHYIDINFNGLLRTSIAEQTEKYNKMFNMGVYSPNDIRRMEDLDPYEGGDRYMVPVNMTVNDNDLTHIYTNEPE